MSLKLDDRDFHLGDWLVQPLLNTVSRGEDCRRVEPRVMQLVVCLAERPREVVSKEDLIAKVWAGTFVSDDALLRAVSELRRILDDDTKDPKFIQTIPKRGYRLIAEVRPAETEVASDAAPKALSARGRRALWWAGSLVLLFALFGYLGWKRFRFEAKPGKVMLVVLPFQNLSGDPGQEYFSDGLTEEMTSELAELQPDRLSVIAFTTAMHYKSAGKPINEIGRELKADYALEGAVRRENDRLRITAQLIRISDQAHVWAQAYDHKLSSILALQRQLAQAVGVKIRGALVTNRSAERAADPSVDPEAYVSYLLAMHFRRQLTERDLEISVGHARKAADLDPNFARAWDALGWSYSLLGTGAGDKDPNEVFPLAKAASDRALAIDPSMGDAYTLRGWIQFLYDWDWIGAERNFKQGVALSPNLANPHHIYAVYLHAMNRLPEARREIEHAFELDPRSATVILSFAEILLASKEEQKAWSFISLLDDPAVSSGQRSWGQAFINLRSGNPKRAAEILRFALREPRPGRRHLLILGEACARTGELDVTRRILGMLLNTPAIQPSGIGRLYALSGDKDQAIRWYEKAFNERDPRMAFLQTVPSDFPLWGDRRFLDLVERMKFPTQVPPI